MELGELGIHKKEKKLKRKEIRDQGSRGRGEEEAARYKTWLKRRYSSMMPVVIVDRFDY